MTDTGKEIVRAARGWIGTRFSHQGRLRKTISHSGGVDCLGLLVGVAQELDLRDGLGNRLSQADECQYSHLPDVQYLESVLARLMRPVDTRALAPGDVLMLQVGDRPQHLGIVSDHLAGLGLIHAYAPARAVVEHALDAWWKKRIHAAFRIENH